MAFVRLINETEPLQWYSWKLPGQLPDAARCVIGIFAARVDLAMQHRRHVVCLFRQQQMKVQLVTQRCTAPRISGATSSAEKHNVLDPYGTSERRGPKTCLQKSTTWNQLAPCGLQPGPLAFSCMAMTMHTDEAWRCFTAMQTPSLSRMTSGQVSSCGQRQCIFRKCLADILGGPQVVRYWHLFVHLA